MGKKFAEYSKFDLSEINKEVLKKWDENQVFAKSMTEREGCPSFVFFEGPPSANGMPGIHHVMARSIKDIFCRYKTMKGFQVKRKAGWDTHGLPVELGVEKALGITKEDIGKTISVAEYNAACRKDVMKFTKEWEDLTHKMGYWVDMQNPYITYDNRYIETLWWLLKQLHKKGLLYKGYTVFTGCGNRLELARAEPARLLPRCKGYNRSGTVQDEEPETRNGGVGYSLFPGMDYDSVDTALEHRSLRRPENRLRGRTDLQRLYGREDDRGTCQSIALYSLQ